MYVYTKDFRNVECICDCEMSILLYSQAPNIGVFHKFITPVVRKIAIANIHNILYLVATIFNEKKI